MHDQISYKLINILTTCQLLKIEDDGCKLDLAYSCLFIIICNICTNYPSPMPFNQKMLLGLPKIQNRYNESSLSRLSSQLSTLAVNRNQSDNRQQKNRLPRKHQSLHKPELVLEDYKGELKNMKEMIAQRNLQRSLLIENKIKRISRLSTQQVRKSLETPRSAVNYISVSPPMPQQIHPPPMMMFNPYVPPYPQYRPEYRSRTYQYSDHDSQIQSPPIRRKHRSRKRDTFESSIPYQKNYDQYEQPKRYKNMNQKSKVKPNIAFLQKRRKKLVKKWKAAVIAILFSLSLVQYANKIMNIRQNIFEKFSKRKFNTQMTMMQKYLVKKCKPFFVYLANQKNTELSMQSDQTERMDNEKAQTAKRLINMLIQGLNQIEITDTNQPATRPIEVTHLFCKHGSFVTQYMTEEELDMVIFSEKNKYLRLERNTQISQIINFICNKILLYNTILHPEKVDAHLFPPDNDTINRNFYFIGSIWYQICLEVQDQYLSQVPPSYQIGNWRKLRQKYKIQPAKSLSVNGVAREEQQMISGLLGKKKIEEIFGNNFWRKEKTNLKNSLQNIHKMLVNHHQQIISKVKF